MHRIEQFYDASVRHEWERLDRHRTEFAVTRRALDAHLPRPPADVLDIGGGPGRYAIALAQQGYVVTLADLSGQCLAFAQDKAREAGAELTEYLHADARDLSRYASNRFDAVLLMGPLYHLIDAEDRRQAVREACRVLKPGGLIFASIITRCAPLRWAAKEQPSYIADDREGFERILATGVNLARPGGGFTDADFMHPSEFAPLMEEAGFETLDRIGCEGIVSQIEEQINPLTGDLWERWVELNYQLGRDPSLHGAAEHLLYVGRKV